MKARDKEIIAGLPMMNPEQMDPILEIIDNMTEEDLTPEQKQIRLDIKKAIQTRNNLLKLFEDLDEDSRREIMK